MKDVQQHNTTQFKTTSKKNKIIKILPWYGDYHSYFQLYLYSIYKNKDCLDLLLIAEEPPSYPLPDNVIFLQKSLEELDVLLKEVIYEQYKISLNSTLPAHVGDVRKSAWKLCDYKPLYGLLFFNHIKEYSHWAFGDCDVIFGDIASSIPKLFTYTLIVGKGHFSAFKTDELWCSGFFKPTYWDAPVVKDYGTNRYNQILEKLKDVTKTHILDESHYIPDAKIYVKHNFKEAKILDIQENAFFCHNHIDGNSNTITQFNIMYCGKHDNPDAQDNHYRYMNGSLYRCSESAGIQKSCIYAHFMGRTRLSQNNVKLEDYDAPLNFTIVPPLTFSQYV